MLNLKVLVSGMDEEEKTCYLETNASSYYRLLEKREPFQRIVEKLDSSVELEESEWEYIFSKLFLVSCRALTEESDYDFMDRVISLFCKMGMKISRKDKGFYNECYRMLVALESYRQEKEINTNLLENLDFVMVKKEESELDLLLKEYQESVTFRDSQDGFLEEYKKGEVGVISPREKIYIHAFQTAYQRERELSKQINQ